MDWIKRRLLKPGYKSLRETWRKTENAIKFRHRLPPVPQLELTKQRNVLLLVVDCLRDDHISRVGYDRQTTPFLDTHGEYTTAISAAPWTYPAVPSILTGRYPHNHGAVFTEELRHEGQMGTVRTLVEDAYTLPELLVAIGYNSFFATAIPTAEISMRGRLPSREISQHAPAEWLTDRFLDWWDEQEDSRFGYVHFGDLHDPLSIPEREPFGTIPDIEGIDRWRFTDTVEPSDEFERFRRERIRLYDTNIREIDAQIGRIYQHLVDTGDLTDTLVIVTGDHGEEFWEWATLERERFYSPRGIYGVGHGHALFPEITDVPLILINNQTPIEQDLVSTVDILPTVLKELGASIDKVGGIDGHPINQQQDERVLYSEEIAYGYNQTAVIRGDDHLIHSPHDEETLRLDRSTGELMSDPETIEELRVYTQYEQRSGQLTEIDEKTQQQLADLGYR